MHWISERLVLVLSFLHQKLMLWLLIRITGEDKDQTHPHWFSRQVVLPLYQGLIFFNTWFTDFFSKY